MGKNSSDKKIKTADGAKDLKKAAELLADAEGFVESAKSNINDMNVKSMSVPGMSAAGIMANIKDSLIGILSKESGLLTDLSDDISSNAKALAKWDDSNNTLKTISSSGTGKKGKTTTTGKVKVFDLKTKSIENNSRLVDNTAVTSLVTNMVINPTIDLKPTVDIRTQELQNLENYLKNGDLASAAKSYEFLKTMGMESGASTLLAKYGYKVEEKDGEYAISKITDDTINNENNSTDGDVVADVTSDTESDTSSTTDNVETNQENNSEQNNTVVNNTTNNNSNDSNNNGGNNTNYNNNQAAVENTSTEVNNQETTSQVETDTNDTIDSTTVIDDSNSSKTDTKTNVVSITDDTETTSTTKKSSGLGAAVPIGLGTIATGAAAVAGVRYVKNRHNTQEEYDENYDDENNDLNEDGEYVDAAQYDDGSSYMDDDYLGPVEDSVSTEEEYVDPEDLEDIESFSEDSVLEDLNSNY